MTPREEKNKLAWQQMMVAMLPFADSASKDLPLSRLLRLSLFQISTGMAAVLLTGTLNRVMIVEMHVSGTLVALMVSLPLVFAPLRALMGYKSDTHKSYLGWRRLPYIFMGTLTQFGGFAFLPFALLILSGVTQASPMIGQVFAGLAFLMVGFGMHMTQTAGLALATDLATEETRPRVVALLYVMLLVGMLISAIVFGAILRDFSSFRLIQTIQGAALATMIFNFVAVWKQEGRDPSRTDHAAVNPSFKDEWTKLLAQGRASRLLLATGLGAAGFAMQDVLLEPYGAEVLGMSVGSTTQLTAIWAIGTLIGFTIAASQLSKQGEPHRLAGFGAAIGAVAFAMVIVSGALALPAVFRVGVFFIGLGGGLFSVGTLTAAMALSRDGQAGMALGVWGAVQATSAGVAIALSGAMRDVFSSLAQGGAFGPAMMGPEAGYGIVYHIEITLLIGALIAIGPLAKHASTPKPNSEGRFGLTEFPT